MVWCHLSWYPSFYYWQRIIQELLFFHHIFFAQYSSSLQVKESTFKFVFCYPFNTFKAIDSWYPTDWYFLKSLEGQQSPNRSLNTRHNFHKLSQIFDINPTAMRFFLDHLVCQKINVNHLFEDITLIFIDIEK